MGKMIRMCLNWKVIAGLSVVGLGVWLIAPNLIAAAIPVLLIAVCPVSMLLMMRAMAGGQHSSQTEDARIDDRVGPTREVSIAELQAQREILDAKIGALQEETSPGARVETGAERDGQHPR